MSYLEWFFIGAIILFFVIVVVFSWSDLMKDYRYYKRKQKNVKSIKAHVDRKRKMRRPV